jgi:tetratricopeptide (TPR) repeat protein/transcriptional regulator with XRE-family HTH domain
VSDDAGADRAARRDRLAARRRALGLTQEGLAALLGVERSTVVRWERGTTQPLPSLRPKLARALQVRVGRLAELLGAPTSAGPDGRGPAAAPIPRQLPAAVAGFTGRARELAALTRMLDQAAADAPGTVVISTIGGTAGVGKTALALHWAHQVAHRFADGQLHANLRGFDPAGAPAAPAQVIRGFLDALGVPPERIPAHPEAQVGLYRSLAADRNMLIVLDNARNAQQVRPLLPASRGSLVLVTSRHQLSGLAADGARLLTLDVLTHHEAIQLLTGRLGAARAAAEPDAVTEIAGLCAGLPLALAVTAARAAARPTFPLAALAAELRDTTGRLDALDAGDPQASVRAVFSWSYRQLTPQAARMYRLLGLHPGPDISAPAAASLAGCDPAEARRRLAELTRDSLLSEPVPGRYALHDLLREYAADQARTDESLVDRQEAIGRVLDHYLQTAFAAAVLLVPSRKSLAATPSPPRAGATPERLDSHQGALDWFAAEHHVLVAAVALAAQAGLDSCAWQIAWAMTDFLHWRGHWQESAALLHTALNCATRLDDSAGQAAVRYALAVNCTKLARYDQARAHVAISFRLFQQLGHLFGQAAASIALGLVAQEQGDHAAAVGHAEQALHLFQAIGDQLGQAVALSNAGLYHSLLGEPQRGRPLYQRALSLFRKLGYRHGEADAWDGLGYAEHHLGHYVRAIDCYGRALGLHGTLRDRYSGAVTLTRLGDVRHAAGDEQHAWDAWQQALAILEDLHHPDAEQVRAKLDTAEEAGRRAPPEAVATGTRRP